MIEDDTCRVVARQARPFGTPLLSAKSLVHCENPTRCRLFAMLTEKDIKGVFLAEWILKKEGEKLQEALYTAWAIWFSRNQLVFDNKSIPVQVIRERVVRGLEEFRQAEQQHQAQHIRAGSIAM